MDGLNQNFQSRVVIDTLTQDWHSSPCSGVRRIYLERDNYSEFAKASSIVEYEADSSFQTHTHENGEEFLVLSGTFSDENGDYPSGTYVRNPHGSSHSPFSKTGCKILVKLRQFDKNDKSRIVIREDDYKWLPGICQGLTVMPLHSYQSEHSALVKWEPHTKFSNHSHWGGEEIYILRGTLFDEFGVYKKGTWIRSPHMSSHNPYTTNDGALIFVKTGHIHE